MAEISEQAIGFAVDGAYSATEIRSLLHADHEQISALTEQIRSVASTQRRVRAFDELKPFWNASAIANAATYAGDLRLTR